MEKKVYVVIANWQAHNNCPDDWYNCSTNLIEGAFSTADLAMDYIRKLLIQRQNPNDGRVLCRVYSQDDNDWDWDWEKYNYDDFKSIVMTCDDPETIEYYDNCGLNWFSIEEYVLNNKEVTND